MKVFHPCRRFVSYVRNYPGAPLSALELDAEITFSFAQARHDEAEALQCALFATDPERARRIYPEQAFDNVYEDASHIDGDRVPRTAHRLLTS